jgi:hypothetical protein
MSWNKANLNRAFAEVIVQIEKRKGKSLEVPKDYDFAVQLFSGLGKLSITRAEKEDMIAIVLYGLLETRGEKVEEIADWTEMWFKAKGHRKFPGFMRQQIRQRIMNILRKKSLEKNKHEVLESSLKRQSEDEDEPSFSLEEKSSADEVSIEEKILNKNLMEKLGPQLDEIAFRIEHYYEAPRGFLVLMDQKKMKQELANKLLWKIFQGDDLAHLLEGKVYGAGPMIQQKLEVFGFIVSNNEALKFLDEFKRILKDVLSKMHLKIGS